MLQPDGVALDVTARHSDLDSVYRLFQTDADLASIDGDAVNPDDFEYLPPVDQPDNPWAFQLFGAGVTHRRSADARDAETSAHWGRKVDFYDKMYQAGVTGGRPAVGDTGAKPEIFYKGNGHQVAAHASPLEATTLARRLAPEPEVVAYFMPDTDGAPRLIGYSGGNDFSDQGWETENPLYLFHAKVQDRLAALGPVFVTADDAGLDVHEIDVRCRIFRDGAMVMDSGPLKTGEHHMAHSIANLQWHLFHHRALRPDEVRCLYLGTTAVFPATVEAGDTIQIDYGSGLGTLRNPVRAG